MPTFAEILDRFEGVDSEGDAYLANCPAHEDSRPSLRIAYNGDTRKVAVRCRVGCQTEAVIAAVGLSFRDLFDVEVGDVRLRTVASDKAGPSVANIAALAAYLDRAADAACEMPPVAVDYAARRFGISPERFRELGLGYDDGSVPAGALPLSPALYHDAPRLVVPFNDTTGRPHYLQARAISADFGGKAKWSGPNNPEGAAWGKYGVLSGGSGWSEVIVTEGPGDGLTAAGVGYDVVLIRGAGVAASLEKHPEVLDDLTRHLSGRKVVVAGDNDAGGKRFNTGVAEALSARGITVHRLVIPASVGKDVTDWRAALGPSFDKELVRAVQEAPRYGRDDIAAEEIAQELSRLFSDVHNARVLLTLIREQGADVRHTPEVGFVVYDPARGTWSMDEGEWTRRQAHRVAERVQRAILAEMAAMDARVAGIDDKELRDSTAKLIDAQRRKARNGSLVSYVLSSHGIDAMLRELRALEGVAASLEDFDQDPRLLAVRNGVLDLETSELTPYGEATKAKLLMRRVDIDYRPGARNPRWEQFLTETFRDHPDIPAYMQRLIGYGISGFTTEQCFAVLWGTGANGKSVFTDSLTAIFRGVTVTTPFSTFEAKPSGGIPNDLAALKGSRLVMASEGDQGKQMAEATIKRLTGQDLISARFMRKEFFEFRPTFLILLATNYKPNFRGQDEGLWRRVKLIPFTRYYAPAERDGYLAAKLAGDVVPRHAYRTGEDYGDGPAGILAWAVEGARAYFASGLGDPPVVTNATEEYRATADALAGYMGEVITRDSTRGAKIGLHRAYELYKQWCDDEGMPERERWKRSTLKDALQERGGALRKSGGVQYFAGLREVRPSEKSHADDATPGAEHPDVFAETPSPF